MAIIRLTACMGPRLLKPSYIVLTLNTKCGESDQVGSPFTTLSKWPLDLKAFLAIDICQGSAQRTNNFHMPSPQPCSSRSPHSPSKNKNNKNSKTIDKYYISLPLYVCVYNDDAQNLSI